MHLASLWYIDKWTYKQTENAPSYHRRSTFLTATKQLYEWFSLSVCPSVRPSVTPFSPCSHHRTITKFSEVITNDRIKGHAKGQGQRSKIKVTDVKSQLNCFRTVTPVRIPTFGNRCLSAIGGGKQRSRLTGWVQLSAEAAPGPHRHRQPADGNIDDAGNLHE